MTEQFVCWACGATLTDLPLPLARLAECPACRNELHVCRLCSYYDTRVANHCREPVAEVVNDKTRANFCGYFQLRANAYRAQDTAVAHAAHTQLAALFGAATDGGANKTEKDPARSALDKLFDSNY